ncbi:MAG: RNA polymerase sigma factor [Melioribacteraceae bacterium]|nr:RNA polymerase sigma factor [Melioribacteraceae bacterium]
MVEEIEKQLVKKFIEGDERAFNELVKNHQQNIYWHARRMVGNHLDADEVTQQVIIVLYKKLSTFKYNASLRTWIYRITQTRCLNLLKKRKIKRFLNLDDENTATLKSNEDIILRLEDKDKIERINRYLEELPLKQREVFVLRHFEELNYEEISEITGKSIGGLKANYFHASKKIFGKLYNEQ